MRISQGWTGFHEYWVLLIQIVLGIIFHTWRNRSSILLILLLLENTCRSRRMCQNWYMSLHIERRGLIERCQTEKDIVSLEISWAALGFSISWKVIWRSQRNLWDGGPNCSIAFWACWSLLYSHTATKWYHLNWRGWWWRWYWWTCASFRGKYWGSASICVCNLILLVKIQFSHNI